MHDLKRTLTVLLVLAGIWVMGFMSGYYEYESQVRKQSEHLNG